MNTKLLYTMENMLEFEDESGTFVQKMLRMFTVNTPVAVADLQRFFKEGNMVKVREVAHRVRPSVEAMCVPEVTTHIQRIEALAASDTASEELKEHLFLFEKLALEVVDQITRLELRPE